MDMRRRSLWGVILPCRSKDEKSSRTGDRTRAREWEADDQRHDRFRSGGRYQTSRKQTQKKREKTWQKSDPHEDLCRIKWEPDPTSIPDNWFRGHIPDMIKCKMFELWQKDPEMYSARVLAKRFGLPYIDTQAILTMKLSSKEKCDTIEGYEIYPELEELMRERKEGFIHELGLNYGHEIPFIYAHCPDIDKNDPSTWKEPKQHKLGKLREMDKNSKFDCPPLQSLDEVATSLNYNRTNKVIYAAVRDEDAAELTEKLVDEPKLEKRRWAYALKDTSNKNTRKISPVLRDKNGIMRAATVSEEKGMSYADENLFRRDVRRSTTLREFS